MKGFPPLGGNPVNNPPMASMEEVIMASRLEEAVHLCKACSLGTQGMGVPGMWINPDNRTRHNEDTLDQQPDSPIESAQPTAPSCSVCCHPADHSCDEPTPPSQEGDPTSLPSQGGARGDTAALLQPTHSCTPLRQDTEAHAVDASSKPVPALGASSGKSNSIDREGYRPGPDGSPHTNECSTCHICNTNRLDKQVVMVLGEAPGGVEQAQGKPFVGQSGELLHSLLKEAGLASYYVSNIVKHRPWVVKGKQQAPDKVAIEACAPFLRAEFELVKPVKLILLGKTAAKLAVPGNFSMKEAVNQTYIYNYHNHYGRGYACPAERSCSEDDGKVLTDHGIPALVLYHPAYFLRQRTAPWIQKQIRDWQAAVRMFMGDRPPTYLIERVQCASHPPS